MGRHLWHVWRIAVTHKFSRHQQNSIGPLTQLESFLYKTIMNMYNS